MPDDADNLENVTTDMKLDAELWKLLEENADCDDDSAALNDKRRRLRDKAEKLGVNSHDFREQVYQMKKRTKAERLESNRTARRFQRIWDNRQGDLWTEDQRKAEERVNRKTERETKAKAKAAEAKAKSIEAGDDNPRSKPKASSAVPPKKPGRKPKVVAGSAADRAAETSDRNKRLGETQAQSPGAQPGVVDPAVHAAEQETGAAILDTAGQPLSQSAQVAAINEKLGLNK